MNKNDILVINESIVLDKVNGDEAKYQCVREKLGPYALRDNILPPKQVCHSEHPCRANAAAVLMLAKKDGDPDFEMYKKAILLMRKCMSNMETKYATHAKEIVDTQSKALESNPRLDDALNTINEQK